VLSMPEAPIHALQCQIALITTHDAPLQALHLVLLSGIGWRSMLMDGHAGARTCSTVSRI